MGDDRPDIGGGIGLEPHGLNLPLFKTHQIFFIKEAMDIDKMILDYYSGADIASLLRNAPGDITRYDDLHIGGRVATDQLIDLLNIPAGGRILDVGCGLGGVARALVKRQDVHVTGIDLSPDYIQAAIHLTESDKINFQVASALDLPFADNTFDGVITVHTAMNISDKAGFYRQIARVIKPDGLFVLYDVMAGAGAGVPQFPLPWSTGPEASFLITNDKLDRFLKGAGFEKIVDEDCTDFAADMLEKATKSGQSNPAMAADFPARIANLADAVANRQCVLTRVLARKIAL